VSSRRCAVEAVRRLSSLREGLPSTPLNSSLSPQERKAAIESGLVPTNTAGLTDDERKSAAFWQRHHGTKKTKEQTLAEKTSKFFTEDVRIGPAGERIVVKKLIEGY
jgi:hypothetical protein